MNEESPSCVFFFLILYRLAFFKGEAKFSFQETNTFRMYKKVDCTIVGQQHNDDDVFQ